MIAVAALPAGATLSAAGEPPRQTCGSRSGGHFPGAFSDPRNLVVGPLVLVGGAAFTTPATIREFDGNKFPLLVRAGRRVTVTVARRARDVASLRYGRGGRHARVTFVACRRQQDSGSDVDGKPVTFWSGFVLMREPRCVPLKVWVGDERTARRATLRMGVRDC